MRFDVMPYVGAGQLRFNMTEVDVIATLGSPGGRSTNWRKEIVLEYPERDLMVGLGTGANAVDFLGFGPQADLRYDGVRIFTDPSAFDRLIAADGQPYEYVGFAFLLNLGMSLGGFHNDEPRSVSIFRQGYNDQLRSKFKTFDIGKRPSQDDREARSL